MLDLQAVDAFLEPSHHDFAAEFDDFCRRLIDPLPAPADDDEGRVQAREVLDWLGGAGWLRHVLESDLRTLCLLRERLAYSSPLADAVVALQALGTTPLLLADNREMYDAWVGPALGGAAMAAFAMTEVEAGSDVGSMRTTARAETNGYVLDGTKTLISNAGIADFYTVFASTDPNQGTRGVSCFVVGAATPGLRFVAPQVMSAPHPLGEIAFEGCHVASHTRLGDEGAGFKLGMMTLDQLRPTVGAAAAGIATRALDEALGHARSRQQFGKPLASFQLIQAKLARMATELTASRLLVYRAAWEKDRGKERITLEAAMGKYYATEAAQRIVDDAVQILGGRGVLANSPVDHLYRAVRALRIYEGTTEIQQLVIADQLLQTP